MGGQLRALAVGARAYGRIALQQMPLIAAIVILGALNSKNYSYWRALWSIRPVWIAPLAGLCMFSLVLVETRYVASFLVITAMCLLASVRMAPSGMMGCVILGLTLAVATGNFVGIARVAPRNAYSALFRPRNVQWEVAQALTERGVRSGDRVATVIDHRLG